MGYYIAGEKVGFRQIKFTNDIHMNLCFDEELYGFLNPDDIVYLSIIMDGLINDKNDISISDFFDSDVYNKLFDYYIEDMPYGVAKFRTGDADIWILDKIRERYLLASGDTIDTASKK